MREETFPALGERYFAETLPNGLAIRVIPKPEFAKTYAFFAADYGSIDTKFNLDGDFVTTPDGVAHYLEHKMFDMPSGSAMQMFSQYGGSPNAFTGYAMTAYYVECTEHWKENLKLLLEFVSTPYFTDETVEKERGIIAQEIRMYEDSADSRMYENLFAALYDHHSIRVPIAGTVESIQQITAQTLRDCHRAFYDPSNMMLCVAGPVDPQVVAELARSVFAPEPGGVSGRDYGPPEELTGHRSRAEARMEVSMPGFVIGFKCQPPQRGADRLRQELLGDLAAELLAGESTALYRRLYESGLIDCDFSVSYEGVKDISLITASGDSRDPDQVMEAILEEARRIRREGADQALFEQLKKSAYGRRMRELDSFENICYRMCQSYFDGVEYYDFPAVYQSITLKEAENLIAETIVPERASISVVYPKEKA